MPSSAANSSTDRAGPSPGWWWAFGAVVFGVLLVIYGPALGGGVLWDDPAHLTAPALQGWSGLGRIWTELGATQQYYPVLHTAFWLEHRLWGDVLWGYHVVNVGLHAAAAALFGAFVHRLRRSESGWEGKIAAVGAAALFAVHPVAVESVAWISEQKNTLSLVFYLLAAHAYWRFAESRRGLTYGVALGWLALALLTKSVTASLPAALLLVRYWQAGRIDWRRDGLPLLPWFGLGLAAGLLTAWVERHYIGAQGADFDLSAVERVFLAGRVVWFYVGKLVWPANLMFIYPRWEVAATAAWSLGALAVVGVLVGCWRWRRHSRGPLVAALFFGGSLFPALGFFNVYPFVFSYVADHWQYLPMLGMCALAAGGAVQGVRALERRLGEPAARAMRGSAVIGAVAVTGLLAVLSWRQAAIYRDVETLYGDTLAKNPTCWLAHNNLGMHLMERGELPAAIEHLEAAIRIKPDCADAYNNLGNAYAKVPARVSESIPAFEQALRYQPAMPEAHSNLGWALVNAPGRVEEGIAHLRRAIQLRPDYHRAHNSLGIALTRPPARLPDAIAEFETALRIDPGYVAARVNLGNALVAAGRPAEAIAQLEQARRLLAQDPQIHFNLGTAWVRHGDANQAIAAFEEALRLNPDYPDAHNNLGSVLAQLGRGDEAITHYRAAVRLDPRSAEAHFNLGRALRGAGDGSEAMTHYRESLRLEPRAAAVWNSLGAYLLSLERVDQAIAACGEAVRLQPDSAPFRNNLGIALTRAGRLDDAIAALRAAVAADGSFGDARYNLAVALAAAGRDAEAAAEFKASGRAEP